MRLHRRVAALMGLLLCAAARALAIPVPESPPQLLTYRLVPGESLRYQLTANIKASAPLFGSATPVDLHALITLVYLASPKTLLADGTSDVEFRVESVEVEIGGEKEKIPIPLEIEQVQDILNQTVTLAKNGEVKQVRGGGPLPFDVSVPGVDPKRLYTLLFPIVFQNHPVKPGDRWTFQSELLGGEGTRPLFSAVVLPAPSATAQKPEITLIRENFSMDIDQKVDADKRPVVGKGEVHRTRKGRIEGSGLLHFDRAQGRFTQGEVHITANIQENLVGKPRTKDEPKQIISKVRAKVTIQLQPAPETPRSSASAEPKEAP